MLSNGRKESRHQDIPTLPRHARCGMSVVAVQAALLTSMSGAATQSGERALPPVTVDAPIAAPHKPRKPAVQSTAARSAKPASSAEGNILAAVATSGQGAGTARGSLEIPPAVARYQLPQRSFTITTKEIDETINLRDPEDAVKYMPSLFVRKRHDGDNQAVLATRSWGLNSSARTLIYYDDLLISALIGNNNSGASPRWNLIVPEAIGPCGRRSSSTASASRSGPARWRRWPH
jgi:iron complex outermembrane receptor protein